jgi:hypothetical protein
VDRRISEEDTMARIEGPSGPLPPITNLDPGPPQKSRPQPSAAPPRPAETFERSSAGFSNELFPTTGLAPAGGKAVPLFGSKVGPGGAAATSEAGARFGAPPRRDKPPDLGELAASPDKAHQRWPSLDEKQRSKVLELMTKRYGPDFASRFLEAQKDKTRQTDLTRTYGPGTGPSEDKLRASGFVPWARGPYNEIWVHPSGETVMKVLDRSGPKTKPTEKEEDPLVADSAATVEGMQAWLDELRKLDPKAEGFEQAYTDFWQRLSEEHHDLEQTLKDPNLEPRQRAGLEAQTRALEAINQQRKDAFPGAGVVGSNALWVDAKGHQWLFPIE